MRVLLNVHRVRWAAAALVARARRQRLERGRIDLRDARRGPGLQRVQGRAEILRNCRRSIAQGGRLLLLEQVMPDGDTPSYAKLLDLIMLVPPSASSRPDQHR